MRLCVCVCVCVCVPRRQRDVWTTVAALLHLGNVRFAEYSAVCPVPESLSALISKSKVQEAAGPADDKSWQALVWAAELFQVRVSVCLCVSTCAQLHLCVRACAPCSTQPLSGKRASPTLPVVAGG